MISGAPGCRRTRREQRRRTDGDCDDEDSEDGVTRAILVGVALWFLMLLYPGVHVFPRHPGALVWFGLMGALMLSFFGLITSIWAEKFDHAAAVTNFVVAPLALLSGTFYSIESLAPAFQTVSHANPFFYVISGLPLRLPREGRFAGRLRRIAAARHQSRPLGGLLRLDQKGVEIETIRLPDGKSGT